MDNDASWDLYRTFLAVMQSGSLSGAARALGLAQPTTGRHVAQLEAAVGTPLFSRSAGGLVPTDAARALLPFAETMGFSAAALLRAAQAERDAVAGTVRVSASEIVAVEVLPPILAALQEDHPGLEIELSASDAVEDLLRRQADIAVRMAPPKQEALRVKSIGSFPLGFHAHRRYLARHGTPTTLAELKAHRLIGFDRQTAYIRAVIERVPEVRDVHFSFRADSNLAQLAALRAGCGIGLCQRGIARRDPDLVPLLDSFSLPLPAWVAMHEDLRGSRRARTVFDALVKGLMRETEGRG